MSKTGWEPGLESVNMASLIPAPNLLEQIEGVEAGLRKLQTIGRVGQYGFVATAILEIVSKSSSLHLNGSRAGGYPPNS